MKRQEHFPFWGNLSQEQKELLAGGMVERSFAKGDFLRRGAEECTGLLDVMATAIRAGMTAQDLEELDLSYAPPYSSAKDPVNMAGFVIGNVRSGLRSCIACRILEGYGFDCYNLSGGYRFYEHIVGDKAFQEEPVHPCGLKIKR